MSLYLDVKNVGGSMAIAVCPRCSMKMYYGDMVQDPNTKVYMHKDCADKYDPWKLPARAAEDITLHHPRPDTDLT